MKNIKVFVNKTACLLQLHQYQRCLSESNDALRLVKNFKNHELSPEDKDLCLKMEVMLLLRWGNSQLHLNKKHDAIKSYEQALELDPRNDRIKADLAKIKT